ncbi:MAG: TetR/AcrR family transcriptional regulator [Myxococcota bacterium]
MSVRLSTEPPRPRIPRTEQTRQRLLDAGLALFARRGPDAVTSHAIAAEAGYAAGTFYLHFDNKQALFQSLADRATTELEDRLATVAAADLDPRRLVEAQAEALVGFAEDHRDLFRVVFRPGSEAGQTGARVLERLALGVSARRRAAMATGRTWDCLDADVLAQAIVGMWVRVLGWWVEAPTRARRQDIVRTLAHFQLHGSRAPDAKPCALAARAPAARRPSRTRPSRPRPNARPSRPRGARRA